MDPAEEPVEDGREVGLLGHVGAQVVQRVAHLADDAPDVLAELFEGGRDPVALAVGLDDAVELEGEVGDRLTDAVVQVAGDAGAFLVAPTVLMRPNHERCRWRAPRVRRSR